MRFSEEVDSWHDHCCGWYTRTIVRPILRTYIKMLKFIAKKLMIIPKAMVWLAKEAWILADAAVTAFKVRRWQVDPISFNPCVENTAWLFSTGVEKLKSAFKVFLVLNCQPAWVSPLHQGGGGLCPDDGDVHPGHGERPRRRPPREHPALLELVVGRAAPCLSACAGGG